MGELSARNIQEMLAMPFAAEDLEWRLQTVFEDKLQGIAVPYVTNRAIQTRLDSVVGVDRWCNEFKPWHGTGKKDAQICGISIFFDDRGWITKWDGAEDSDIESVKGGLSDSMKRAAVQWGIGRVLYEMDTVYVGVDKRGKNFYIKKEERAKLDRAYLSLLKSLSLQPASAGGIQSVLAGTPVPSEAPAQQNKTVAIPTAQQTHAPQNTQPAPVKQERPAPVVEFTVQSAKLQGGMSGKSTSLTLIDPNGKKALGFVRGEHPELQDGVKLFNVQKTLKQQDSVVFYLLDSFEIEQSNAA